MAEQGGFDCEFVEKPPEPFQSECPVCLLVLRDPYQATCCGYGFCQGCIERIKLQNTPCPCCKAENFDRFPDKRLRRSLYGYKVNCTYIHEGCEWVGELGELDNHLNSKPPQDRQLEGCQFVQIPCLTCSKLMPRSNVKVHQSDMCPKRPFTCQYCYNYDSYHEDVTANHWPVCGYYLVSCPTGCGLSMERRSLHRHVNETCTNKELECDFSRVGCNVRLPRKDMPTHLADSLTRHMSLLLLNQTELQAENSQLKARCNTLEEENRQQAMDFAQLDAKYQQLVSKQENYEQNNTRLMKKYSITQAQFSGEIDTLRSEINTLQLAQGSGQSEQQQFGMPVRSLDFTMTTFDYYRRYNKQWFSPPFYTHPYGYKMCLSVDATGWGIGTRRTYISVYVLLMKGEFDDNLKWPFHGNLTIELLNQERDDRNHTRVITFMEMTSNSIRVTKGTRAASGPGIVEFISHSELQPNYLKNGYLQFRVSQVEFNF